MKKIILVIAMFLGGCAITGPVIAPNSAYHLMGAVVYSPEIGNWNLIQHTKHGVAFGRRMEGDGGTVIANAVLFAADESENDKNFLDNIEQQREMQTNPARFKVLVNKHEQVIFKDVPCLKYQILAEDHKSNEENSGGLQYLKIMGYICRHPANKMLALQMEFSNRSHLQIFPESLLSVSDAFFKKIRFDDAALK